MSGRGDSVMITGTTALVGPDLERREADILIEGGRIKRIGSLSSDARQHIDGEGLIALPGLINAHVHINDAPLQDLGTGRTLEELVHPVHGLKNSIYSMTLEVRKRSLERMVEEIAASGTTAAADFHEDDPSILSDTVKGKEGSILIPLTRPPVYSSEVHISENIPLSREQMEEFSIRLAQCAGAGLSGTNEYSDAALDQVAQAAQGKIVGIHAAENAASVRKSLHLTGRSEVERAVENLSPDFLVHLTQASAADLDIVEDAGISAVCCPRSNAIMGSGIPPIIGLKERGVHVALGTDNVMLNSPDLFREMDFTSRVLRASSTNPSIISSLEILKMVTSEAALALSLEGTGALMEGYSADIVLLNGRSAHLRDTKDIHAAIVHRCDAGDVFATLKAGRLIYHARERS